VVIGALTLLTVGPAISMARNGPTARTAPVFRLTVRPPRQQNRRRPAGAQRLASGKPARAETRR
jgi:hypothetical protein